MALTQEQLEKRQSAIASLREICRDIGCSGWSVDLCENRPHDCKIIRNLMNYTADGS